MLNARYKDMARLRIHSGCKLSGFLVKNARQLLCFSTYASAILTLTITRLKHPQSTRSSIHLVPESFSARNPGLAQGSYTHSFLYISLFDW